METFYYRYFNHRRMIKNALLFILAGCSVATCVILVYVRTKGV
jgi:hypothetical protein